MHHLKRTSFGALKDCKDIPLLATRPVVTTVPKQAIEQLLAASSKKVIIDTP